MTNTKKQTLFDKYKYQYLTDDGYLQNGPGTSKELAAKLELVQELCTQEDISNLTTLHRMYGFTKQSSILSEMKIYSDFILYYEPREYLPNLYLWTGGEINLADEQTKTKYRFAHYTISDRDVVNPNFENIMEKRRATIKLRNKISKESKVISGITNDIVKVKSKFIRELINIELKKYGHPELKNSIGIYIDP